MKENYHGLIAVMQGEAAAGAASAAATLSLTLGVKSSNVRAAWFCFLRNSWWWCCCFGKFKNLSMSFVVIFHCGSVEVEGRLL